MTTVRYMPDVKRVLSFRKQDSLPGCAEAMGHNNPLQSRHPGVISAAFADGSVCFISGTTDFSVLLRLAIRYDGGEHQSDGRWLAE